MVTSLSQSVPEVNTYVLPVKRESEETQSLIVGGPAEDVGKNRSFATSSLHSSQALHHWTLVNSKFK